jgi:hypothetical protein
MILLLSDHETTPIRTVGFVEYVARHSSSRLSNPAPEEICFAVVWCHRQLSMTHSGRCQEFSPLQLQEVIDGLFDRRAFFGRQYWRRRFEVTQDFVRSCPISNAIPGTRVLQHLRLDSVSLTVDAFVVDRAGWLSRALRPGAFFVVGTCCDVAAEDMSVYGIHRLNLTQNLRKVQIGSYAFILQQDKGGGGGGS